MKNIKKTLQFCILLFALCIFFAVSAIVASAESGLTQTTTADPIYDVAFVTDSENNDVYYTTLKAAVDAAYANGGGKITLVADCTLDEEVIFQKHSYILEMDKYSLYSESGVLMIDSDATLDINTQKLFEAKINTTGEYSYAITNHGTLRIHQANIKGAGAIMNDGTLTVESGRFEASVYSAVENRGKATLGGGEYYNFSRVAITNQGELDILGGIYGGSTIFSVIKGRVNINQGDFRLENNGNKFFSLSGGSTTVVDGIFKDRKADKAVNVSIADGASLSLKGGNYVYGLEIIGAAVSDVIADGYLLFDEDLQVIDLENEITLIDGNCRVFIDKPVVAVTNGDIVIEALDSFNDVFGYTATNFYGFYILRDVTDETVVIPSTMNLTVGKNRFLGDVTNHGDIIGGVFEGNVINDGTIIGGSFLGGLTTSTEINSGHFDCEVVLESGASFKSKGKITIGEGFKLTNNGGTVECTRHYGPSTCLESICSICNASFAPQIDHASDSEGYCISGCGEKIFTIIDGVAYLDGGDVTDTGIKIDYSTNKKLNWIYKAGDGYVIFKDGMLFEFHNATIRGTVDIEYIDRVVIELYGNNAIYGNGTDITLAADANTDMVEIIAIQDATLDVYGAKDNYAMSVEALNIFGSGTVNVYSGELTQDFLSSNLLRGIIYYYNEEIIIGEEITLNVLYSKTDVIYLAPGISTIGASLLGKVNTIAISELLDDMENAKITITLDVIGEVELTESMTMSTKALEDFGDFTVCAVFRVPAGSKLTVAEGVTLDLTHFEDIIIDGEFIVEGTVLCKHEGGEADCKVLAKCDKCLQYYGEYDKHVPVADDGDCTTDVSCLVCGGTAIKGKPHIPAADDRDCTTEIICAVCGITAIEGAEEHSYVTDNNITKCEICGKVHVEKVIEDTKVSVNTAIEGAKAIADAAAKAAAEAAANVAKEAVVKALEDIFAEDSALTGGIEAIGGAISDVIASVKENIEAKLEDALSEIKDLFKRAA